MPTPSDGSGDGLWFTPEQLAAAIEAGDSNLSAEERAEHKRCVQSVIDARRSAERIEGQHMIGCAGPYPDTVEGLRRQLMECEDALLMVEQEHQAFREQTLKPLNEREGGSIESMSWDDLLGVAVRLRKERDEAEKLRLEAVASFDHAYASIRRIARERDALRNYALHTTACAKYKATGPTTCTCGLANVLREPSAEGDF